MESWLRNKGQELQRDKVLKCLLHVAEQVRSFQPEALPQRTDAVRAVLDSMHKTTKKMVQSWEDFAEVDRVDRELDALCRVLSVSGASVKSLLFNTTAKGSVQKATAPELHFLIRTARAYLLWARVEWHCEQSWADLAPKEEEEEEADIPVIWESIAGDVVAFRTTLKDDLVATNCFFGAMAHEDQEAAAKVSQHAMTLTMGAIGQWLNGLAADCFRSLDDALEDRSCVLSRVVRPVLAFGSAVPDVPMTGLVLEFAFSRDGAPANLCRAGGWRTRAQQWPANLRSAGGWQTCAQQGAGEPV